MKLTLLIAFDQSLEWNEELAEEQGGGESPTVADDIDPPNSDKKEDILVNVTEENEWEKLLRIRCIIFSSFSSLT